MWVWKPRFARGDRPSPEAWHDVVLTRADVQNSRPVAGHRVPNHLIWTRPVGCIEDQFSIICERVGALFDLKANA